MTFLRAMAVAVFLQDNNTVPKRPPPETVDPGASSVLNLLPLLSEQLPRCTGVRELVDNFLFENIRRAPSPSLFNPGHG